MFTIELLDMSHSCRVPSALAVANNEGMTWLKDRSYIPVGHFLRNMIFPWL